MTVVVIESYLPFFAAISFLFGLCALLRMPRFAGHFLTGHQLFHGSLQEESGQFFRWTVPRQAAKVLLGKAGAGTRSMVRAGSGCAPLVLLGGSRVLPVAHWPSPVPVRNTPVTAGAVQGCHTGKTVRSGLLSDLKGHTGPFHHTSFRLKVF